MDRAVCLYALLGLFAGSIFSSCISGTPGNFEAEQDCNLLSGIGKSLSTTFETICIGFLIVAIKFLHNLSSRCDKAPAPYTMIMPFWVAFTLSVTYMSEFSLS